MKSIKLFRIFSKKRKLIENLDWNFDQNFAETQNNFLHPASWRLYLNTIV